MGGGRSEWVDPTPPTMGTDLHVLTRFENGLCLGPGALCGSYMLALLVFHLSPLSTNEVFCH